MRGHELNKIAPDHPVRFFNAEFKMQNAEFMYWRGSAQRLPLMRELSAKLTEGEILHRQIYVFAYTAKIAVNIQITDSDYC